MKSLLKLVLIGSAAFGAFQAFGHPVLGFLGIEDRYQVKWLGGTGQPLYGSYTISELDGSKPIRIEKVEASLPHTVNFSAPKNAIVSAAGFSTSSDTVTVTIYKNGSECGQSPFIGSGAVPAKVCQ